jgi:hypothetical protein
MVSGERALQAGRLLFLENRRLIRSHQESITRLSDQWSEVGDLQGLVGEQRLMIESLRDRVEILERRERRRRSRGSLSSGSFHSLGSPILVGRGSREEPFVLEDGGLEYEEGEGAVAGPVPREVVVEDEMDVPPIPVPPPRDHAADRARHLARRSSPGARARWLAANTVDDDVDIAPVVNTEDVDPVPEYPEAPPYEDPPAFD